MDAENTSEASIRPQTKRWQEAIRTEFKRFWREISSTKPGAAQFREFEGILRRAAYHETGHAVADVIGEGGSALVELRLLPKGLSDAWGVAVGRPYGNGQVALLAGLVAGAKLEGDINGRDEEIEWQLREPFDPSPDIDEAFARCRLKAVELDRDRTKSASRRQKPGRSREVDHFRS